jgi:putative YhdH/YhfP family quinone oxidoreductase
VRAVVLTEADGEVDLSVRDIEDPARDGDVLIDVQWSSLNFKDFLVAQAGSRVRRAESLVIGVEAAGRVVDSPDESLRPGDEVICYGNAIGVGRDGGFAEKIAAPTRYVTKLPQSEGFGVREAMTFGLAGYTAMDSVLALEGAGLRAGDGEVLVTGATGSVGSLAVTLLARRGHRVVASSGSPEHTAWLTALGASSVIGREEIADRPDRVLAGERWAGAIDCIGGNTLQQILRSLRYGGAVAASGLVAGAELHTTVYPFITRGVSLIGIDSVESTSERRREVWSQLAEAYLVSDVSLVERVIGLEEVAEGISAIGASSTRGRWLVSVTQR